MRHKVLSANFFNRPTVVVAKELLGKFLVRRFDRKTIAAMITEVEAYDGFKDRASHASRGRTKRNIVMFGPAGRWYVYFVYGMHWMLNIVIGPSDYPAAVLIRGLADVDGPGRLTRFLKIGRKFNGLSASKKTGLWIEDRGIKVPPSFIKQTPRVGVGYAGPLWSKKPWRFLIDKPR